MKVPASFGDRQVCIIGLGYVGLTLAVAMAEAGFKIAGVEKVSSVRDTIRAGHAHFRETGLDPRLLAQVTAGSISVAANITEVAGATTYIVTVGTPLVQSSKVTNLEPMRSVAEALAAILKSGDLVILRSTVRVGVTRDVVKPILDRARVPYDLAFCPERTLEGRALEELLTLPQIVGGLNEQSTIRAAQMFSFLTPTTVKVQSLETAEVIKLVNNTQRDLMFAFANEVAHISDAVGISAAEVIRAGNMGYARASMPLPGPVGGPCLEKDPYILSEGVTARGGVTLLALAGRRLNEMLPSATADRVAGYWSGHGGVQKGMKVSICGLAFKGRPETSDLRGTVAIPLIEALRTALPDVHLVGFDPAVYADEAAMLGIYIVDTVEEAFTEAHICIFQTNHRSFESLRLGDLSEVMAPGGLIYDYWNQFVPDQHVLAQGVQYASLGGWCNIAPFADETRRVVKPASQIISPDQLETLRRVGRV